MCRRGTFTLHFINPPPPSRSARCRRICCRLGHSATVGAAAAACRHLRRRRLRRRRCRLRSPRSPFPCFRLPPPFFPAPAVATAAVCRRHCQCFRHHHRLPCSFCRHRCRCRRRRRPPPPPPAAARPVSVAAVSVAAVSAAATIAVSADIAAAFWLIVVCPRLPLFRSPSPP